MQDTTDRTLGGEEINRSNFQTREEYMRDKHLVNTYNKIDSIDAHLTGTLPSNRGALEVDDVLEKPAPAERGVFTADLSDISRGSRSVSKMSRTPPRGRIINMDHKNCEYCGTAH